MTRFPCPISGMTIPSALAAAVLCAVAVAPPAALAASSDELKAELLEELRQRDELIRQLEARVQALEGRPAAAAPAPGAPAGAGVAAAPATPPSPGGAPSGGGLEVDPVAAERALERTLTNVGSLLLPEGKADVSPFMSYQYSDISAANRIIFADLNGDGIAESPLTETTRLRRDEFDAGVDFRLGLPYDSQVELRLPFTVARARSDGTLQRNSQESTAGGLGNIRAGVAKTLVRESGWVPDVIGRVSYTAPTGPEIQDGVFLNSQFHQVDASVSFLKRQDPLAFSARFDYQHSFEDDGVKPGGLFGVNLGAFLAVSPETSLSLGFSASHRNDFEIDGVDISGSEERQALATFGVSSILYRNVLLNLNVGVGLTDDTPDFGFIASVPIRFGVW